MRKYSAAVWSIGNHAKRNLMPALAESKHLDLYGAYSRNHKIVDECCQAYNCRGYESHGQMLSDPDLDVIILAGPNGLHYEQAKLCLQYGKNIIVEKTAFPGAEQTKEIINLAIEKKLVIKEAFMFEHHEQFKQLQMQSNILRIINNYILRDYPSMFCRVF